MEVGDACVPTLRAEEAQPASQPPTTAFPMSPFSLGILNMGQFLHQKNKNPCRCEQLPCLLPSPSRPPTAVLEAHGFPWDCPGGEAKFCFWWLHWVINSALAFDPKEIGCNSVMFRLNCREVGWGVFFPRVAPHRKPFSRDPAATACLWQLSVSAWSSAPLGRQDQAA